MTAYGDFEKDKYGKWQRRSALKQFIILFLISLLLAVIGALLSVKETQAEWSLPKEVVIDTRSSIRPTKFISKYYSII